MKRAKIERIGVLTRGGDCPGLNAVIRGVVRAAHERGRETCGFSDGYEGLLSPVRYRKLDPIGVDSIMPMGGTILGTVNRGRFEGRLAQPSARPRRKGRGPLGQRTLPGEKLY